MSCIFCAIVDGDAPAAVLHRDDDTVAFLDINPVTRGHALVVPTTHSDDLWDVDEATAAAVMRTSHRVAGMLRDALAPDGLNLFHATRMAACQTVFHLHVHVLPCWAGDIDPADLPWHPQPTTPEALMGLAEEIVRVR